MERRERENTQEKRVKELTKFMSKKKTKRRKIPDFPLDHDI